MTNRPQSSLDRLRDRIEGSDEMAEDDREVLQDFDQQLSLLKTEYSTQRQEKLLRHCTTTAEEVGGLADSLTDRDAAEDMIARAIREAAEERGVSTPDARGFEAMWGRDVRASVEGEAVHVGGLNLLAHLGVDPPGAVQIFAEEAGTTPRPSSISCGSKSRLRPSPWPA